SCIICQICAFTVGSHEGLTSMNRRLALTAEEIVPLGIFLETYLLEVMMSSASSGLLFRKSPKSWYSFTSRGKRPGFALTCSMLANSSSCHPGLPLTCLHTASPATSTRDPGTCCRIIVVLGSQAMM